MNPIFIHKGDSTIFADVQKFLTFNIKTDLDLTGWKAVFMLGSIIKEITDISSKKFDIILTQQETSKLWYGDCCGCIKLIDANGNIKTVCNKIPFSITNQVVENNQEDVNLNIPNSCGIDIELIIGTPYDKSSVTSVNGQIGEVVLTAQDVGAITQTDVLALIAQIPQFNLSIVNELPTQGEKMTIYLVPKEGTDKDIYNEYIWIEQTNLFEFIGTTAVDLTDYVKKTDYATASNYGVARANSTYGINATNGTLEIVRATKTEIDGKTSTYKPITPANLNYAVNSVLPTMTQAEYDALGTKDENLFYMIIEG